MESDQLNSIAVWALTPNGRRLAETIGREMAGEADVFLSQNISGSRTGRFRFRKLGEAIQREFNHYRGHIFFMSTGIVVRLIAPLIRHKTLDPAVVVVDDGGHHAISLLSGHLGGANALTARIAAIIGARSVITTATDVNRVPAIDVLAGEKGLDIANPAAIKTVNMALLKGEKIVLYDPHHFFKADLPDAVRINWAELNRILQKNEPQREGEQAACVFVDDVAADLPAAALVLRPASLFAGIGCNRSTASSEILAHLAGVLRENRLAPASVSGIASIDVKSDEEGLILAAKKLELPLTFFNRQELNQVKTIQNPSKIVEQHVGVKSVCEAAAILASGHGALIVPKQSTKNVTVAIARINYLSSGSGRAARSI